MDDAQHSLQRKLEQERRHLACLCAGFALPHGHGDEADNARDEMAELLAWSHANLCAARIRALEGLLGDLRCSGRRLCMDCGEEIPLSRLLVRQKLHLLCRRRMLLLSNIVILRMRNSGRHG